MDIGVWQAALGEDNMDNDIVVEVREVGFTIVANGGEIRGRMDGFTVKGDVNTITGKITDAVREAVHKSAAFQSNGARFTLQDMQSMIGAFEYLKKAGLF